VGYAKLLDIHAWFIVIEYRSSFCHLAKIHMVGVTWSVPQPIAGLLFLGLFTTIVKILQMCVQRRRIVSINTLICYMYVHCSL